MPDNREPARQVALCILSGGRLSSLEAAGLVVVYADDLDLLRRALVTEERAIEAANCDTEQMAMDTAAEADRLRREALDRMGWPCAS